MKKNKITFENMLAGLLVIFGKVNMIDLKVVQNDLFNRYGILMGPFAIDYRGIQLTNYGRATLFELEYREQVDEFRELLKSEGYDVNLIPEFLSVQDFNRDVYDILNIDNFLLYCSKYDRVATASSDTVFTPVKKNQ